MTPGAPVKEYLGKPKIDVTVVGDGEPDRRLHDVERGRADLDRLIEDVLTTARLEAGGTGPEGQLQHDGGSP
jgi:hypothetical protein